MARNSGPQSERRDDRPAIPTDFGEIRKLIHAAVDRLNADDLAKLERHIALLLDPKAPNFKRIGAHLTLLRSLDEAADPARTALTRLDNNQFSFTCRQGSLPDLSPSISSRSPSIDVQLEFLPADHTPFTFLIPDKYNTSRVAAQKPDPGFLVSMQFTADRGEMHVAGSWGWKANETAKQFRAFLEAATLRVGNMKIPTYQRSLVTNPDAYDHVIYQYGTEKLPVADKLALGMELLTEYFKARGYMTSTFPVPDERPRLEADVSKTEALFDRHNPLKFTAAEVMYLSRFIDAVAEIRQSLAEIRKTLPRSSEIGSVFPRAYLLPTEIVSTRLQPLADLSAALMGAVTSRDGERFERLTRDCLTAIKVIFPSSVKLPARVKAP